MIRRDLLARTLAMLSLTVAAFAASFSAFAADKPTPIQIADVKHDGPVDFEKEILPILRKNCLACHNATEAEGKLVLEQPATILKGGGDGPAVVPGKSGESLLLLVASRAKEPVMPPPDNDVGAKPLTPDELGLIKVWIDQGAKGEVKSATAGPVVWQQLPPGVNPVYAVAMTADGRYAAAGRANQVFLYHVPSKRELGRLTDPALVSGGPYQKPGVAHLDLVQSMAFHPDGTLLATGAFREVKLWRRPTNVKKLELAATEGAARSLAVSRDGKWAALGEENGKVKLYDLSNGQVVRTLEGHSGPATGVAFSPDGAQIATGGQDKFLRVYLTADGKLLLKVETPAPVRAALFAAEGKQIVTAHEDNLLRSWATPAADANPDGEAPKPLKEFSGHTGPVTALAPVDAAGVNVVSGSQDGTIRLWGVAGGNMIRQMSHGAPIVSVTARADGKRFVTAGANSAKLWDGENGQMVAELKGNPHDVYLAGEAARAAALAKRHVDNAAKDLKDLQDRKKQEDDNKKKAEEAMKKADEDMKKKTEDAKKPVADKEAADKDLEVAKANFTKAEEAKKKNDEAAKATEEELKRLTEEREKTKQPLADAEAAAKQTDEKLAAAKKASEEKPDDAGLKEAVAAAQKASDEAQANLKAKTEAKAAADKARDEAEAKNKVAQEAKAATDKDFTAAQQAMQQADQKVKSLAPAYQKAVDEKNSAERTYQAAMRSVERAMEAVKQLDADIPNAEKEVQARTDVQKQKDMEVMAAQKSVTDGEKPVKWVAISPDGKLVASAGDDQIVHLWDSQTGAMVENLTGQNVSHTGLAFASDGLLVSAGQDGKSIVWDVNPDWKLERTIGGVDSTAQFVDRVTALDFSPDGNYLATGGGEPSRSGELKVWKVADGTLVQEFKDAHSDEVYGLEFSPDGAHIASCGADRFMKVFHVATGKFVKAFEGHTHHVLGVSWQADGRTLVSSGADKVCKVWDFRTGDQQRTVQGFNKEVTAVRFLRDAARIDRFVSSSGDNAVRLTRAGDGGNERSFQGATDYLYSVAVSVASNRVIGGGQDSIVRIWDLNTGTLFVQFDPPKIESPMPAEAAMK